MTFSSILWTHKISLSFTQIGTISCTKKLSGYRSQPETPVVFDFFNAVFVLLRSKTAFWLQMHQIRFKRSCYCYKLFKFNYCEVIYFISRETASLLPRAPMFVIVREKTLNVTKSALLLKFLGLFSQKSFTF